jgi:hypothetical protein
LQAVFSLEVYTRTRRKLASATEWELWVISCHNHRR